MMGLKIVIFALLLISLQQAVGGSSKSIQLDDSENETAEHSHHQLHRREFFGRVFKWLKNKDNSKTQFSSNMKWGAYQDNQDNLVSVSMKEKKIDDVYKKYYITRDNNCIPSFIDIEIKDFKSKFLVNPNNIEDLEWKPLKRKFIFFKVIPPFPIETCDGYIIARNNQGLGYIRAKDKSIVITNDKNPKWESLEVLTINFENITQEYLTNVQFTESAQRNKRPSIFRNFTVVNNNCNSMKQQVKIDNAAEETASFQTGNTLLIGGSLGIKKLIEAGVKFDYTETETESSSNIKKTGYQYTQELDIPPRCSCNLVIDSTVFVNTVPFTADLTRVYKNDDVRTAVVDGTYSYQEISDIKTNFVSCTELSGIVCKVTKSN